MIAWENGGYDCCLYQMVVYWWVYWQPQGDNRPVTPGLPYLAKHLVACYASIWLGCNLIVYHGCCCDWLRPAGKSGGQYVGLFTLGLQGTWMIDCYAAIVACLWLAASVTKRASLQYTGPCQLSHCTFDISKWNGSDDKTKINWRTFK